MQGQKEGGGHNVMRGNISFSEFLSYISVPSKEWKDQDLDQLEVKKIYNSFAKNPATSMPPHVYTVVFPKKRLTQDKVLFL